MQSTHTMDKRLKSTWVIRHDTPLSKVLSRGVEISLKEPARERSYNLSRSRSLNKSSHLRNAPPSKLPLNSFQGKPGVPRISTGNPLEGYNMRPNQFIISASHRITPTGSARLFSTNELSHQSQRRPINHPLTSVQAGHRSSATA